MPSIEHEAVVQLILNNPRVLEVLLAVGGVVVPPDKNPEIALKPETARASRKLIQTGHPGFGLTPIVVAFDNSPLSGGARPDPELLLLAVLTGRLDLSDHETQMLILTVLRTLKRTGVENFASYTRLIRYLAPPTARRALGELMKITFPRDDFIDGLIDEGMAHALLRFVTARGFGIPDDIRDTVLSCADTSQLEAWCDRAATAPSIDEIFKR